MSDLTATQPPPITRALIRRLLQDLGLPDPQDIEKSTFVTLFNTVYMLTFDAHPSLAPAEATEPDGSTKLFLRLALPYFPRLVATEVAVLKWLNAHTSIPGPLVLRSDDTTNNVLCREFTLLQKAPGIRVDQV